MLPNPELSVTEDGDVLVIPIDAQMRERWDQFCLSFPSPQEALRFLLSLKAINIPIKPERRPLLIQDYSDVAGNTVAETALQEELRREVQRPIL